MIKKQRVSRRRGEKKIRYAAAGKNPSRMLLFFLFAGGLAFAAPRIHSRLAELDLFILKEIEIEGISESRKQSFEKEAGVFTGGSIFSADLSGIRERIGAMRHIEKYSVKRSFPDKIKISVREREPFAWVYENGQYLCMDAAGALFSAEMEEVKKHPELAYEGNASLITAAETAGRLFRNRVFSGDSVLKKVVFGANVVKVFAGRDLYLFDELSGIDEKELGGKILNMKKRLKQGEGGWLFDFRTAGITGQVPVRPLVE